MVQRGVWPEREQDGRLDGQRDQGGVAEDVDAVEGALPLAALHASRDLGARDTGGEELVTPHGGVLPAAQLAQTRIDRGINRHNVRQRSRFSPLSNTRPFFSAYRANAPEIAIVVERQAGFGDSCPPGCTPTPGPSTLRSAFKRSWHTPATFPAQVHLQGNPAPKIASFAARQCSPSEPDESDCSRRLWRRCRSHWRRCRPAPTLPPGTSSTSSGRTSCARRFSRSRAGSTRTTGRSVNS